MGDVLHEGDQLLGRSDLGLRRLQRDAAAIEHDEAVGDIVDVVDVVADEEDRAAAGAHRRTKRKTFSVSVSDSAVVGSSRTMSPPCCRWRGRWRRPGARRRKAGRRSSSGVKTFEVKPISRISRSASAISLADVEEAEPAGDLAAHEDVADDGLLDGERAILEHRLDAGVARAGARSSCDRLAADEDLAAGRLDHAGEDLDQRRLAGAIVADQADDLAAVDVQVDAAEREDAAVGLGDVRSSISRRPWPSSRTGCAGRGRPAASGIASAGPRWRGRRPPCSCRG